MTRTRFWRQEVARYSALELYSAHRIHSTSRSRSGPPKIGQRCAITRVLEARLTSYILDMNDGRQEVLQVSDGDLERYPADSLPNALPASSGIIAPTTAVIAIGRMAISLARAKPTARVMIRRMHAMVSSSYGVGITSTRLRKNVGSVPGASRPSDGDCSGMTRRCTWIRRMKVTMTNDEGRLGSAG